MRLDAWVKRVLSVILLVLTGWMTFTEASMNGRRFIFGQVIKEFEMIHTDDFCEKNAKGASQCARMNANYLKVYCSLFATIAWGGAVRTVIKTFQLSIPYTVVLLITGLVLGLGSRVDAHFCETWSMFTKFARTPPELILYIFLPLLIFESAFSMKSHVFMTNFLSISVVALPGMLLSTLFTALACRQFMASYAWTFAQAGLFGAIISATDPVAVVAILRELGTSENLSVMIEGESLLNDGVAILLFHILKEAVEDPDVSGHPYHIFITFVKIAIGGPTFGYAMGKVAIWCLTMIFNDAATEITITLVAAYLTYFVGEFYLGVSGVMAVVLLGVTINAGSTCISPEVMHTMHIFWEMMSFLANTVLFVILGIVISETAINSFENEDGLNLIGLYITLNLIRLVMLFVLSPILRRVGYDANWKNLTVMMWGGLRGAVGVCLALEVYRSKKICMYTRVGPKFLLHTAGIVILTLIINGSTTKSLLDYLGVTTLSLGKLHDMAHVVRNLTAARVRTIIALKHDRFLADANWEIVHRFTHIQDPYANNTKKGNAKKEAAAAQKQQNENKAENLIDASAILNEKLITGGFLSSARLKFTQSSTNVPINEKLAADRPIIELKSEPSLLLIHQGKIKRPTTLTPSSSSKTLLAVDAGLDNEFGSDSDDDHLDMDDPEAKKLMEESRSRVLKSMKISCWTQYEKGALSEEGVKVLVGAIEAKEDMHLKMIHVKDLNDHWEIKGVIAWLRNKIIEMTTGEVKPTKPKAKWRHPFYWLTTQPWFHGIIYFVIFVNLAPIIFETVLLATNREAKPGPERDFLFISTITFTTIYFFEFLFKIIGRGITDYCNSRWNLLDFFVLLVSLAEFGIAIGTRGWTRSDTDNLNSENLIFFKIIRVVRFVRLLRWARPILPKFTRIIEIRVNARLFKGYDIGTGYIRCLEDALRLLPTIITNKMICRKFRNLLDADRLEAVRELLKLQMDHSGVVVAVKTRHASRAICGYMKEELETMKLEGLLEEKEFDLLTSKIDGNLKKLWASPNKLKLSSIDFMIETLPWLVGNDEMIAFFKETHILKAYMEGDELDGSAGIYLITSGMVKLRYTPTRNIINNLTEHGIFPNAEFLMDFSFASTQLDFMGLGGIIGEYGFISKLPRAASIMCATDVEVVFWSNPILENGLSHFNDPHDSLEGRLWRSWGIKMAAEFLHTTAQYGSWSSDKIRAHLEQGVVPIGKNFNSIEVPEYIEEVILIQGELINDTTTEVAIAPALVPPTWTRIGQRPGSAVEPRLIIICQEDHLDTLNDSASQTSLDKVILHGPGVAMGLKDHESDHLLSKKSNERRRSVPYLSANRSSGGRRKSTLEAQIKGVVKRTLTKSKPSDVRDFPKD